MHSRHCRRQLTFTQVRWSVHDLNHSFSDAVPIISSCRLAYAVRYLEKLLFLEWANVYQFMPTTDFSFFHTTKYRLSLCLSIALFFYFFMIFFLPFGVDNYNPQHQCTLEFLLELFYFFVVILLFLFFNEFVLHPLFLQKASVPAIIIWTLWTFLLLSTVCFFT